MENDLVTKSELKQLQLIAKLEDTVEVLTSKLKASEAQNEELSDKLETAKLLNTKLAGINDEQTIKIQSCEKDIEGLKAQLKTETENKNIVIHNHAPVKEAEPDYSEKINQLETELTEAKKVVPAPTVEDQIRKGLDSNGRIHERILRFILKSDKLPTSFQVSNLLLKRVFLNKEYYQLIS